MFDEMNLYRRVILTGAGLSRNWGGYLASEMWGAVLAYPPIRRIPALRGVLLEQDDFEAALGTVRTQFESVGREVFEEAIRNAFLLHERNLCHGLDEGRAAWHEFYEVVRPLAENAQRGLTSFMFTLNQDLLLERAFHRPVPNEPSIPGVDWNRNAWFLNGFENWNLSAESAPSQAMVSAKGFGPHEVNGQFNYIKLHGSFNWRTNSGDDVMVLGTHKDDTISRFPVLVQYHEILARVLMAGGVRLLIVGYSFSDDHINAQIDRASRERDLEIIIADTRPPKTLRETLRDKRLGFWRNIVGYFGRPMAETFGRSNEGRQMRLALHG